MTTKRKILSNTSQEPRIITVRGIKVILDSDLAKIYEVSTKRLNEQIKRNLARFPVDFVLQLNEEDMNNLRSQIATSSLHGGRRYLPYAFTEHGAIMAATVLNSPRAIEMSVFVVRAFVRMRGLLGDTRELARQLADLEKELKERLDVHEVAIVGILQRVMNLIDPPEFSAPPRKQIGFKVKEKAARYRVTKRSTKSC